MIANPVPWPNGARCAVAFTFDMDADSILHLAHHTSADTRLAAMSMLRYGPEIAVPRLVELYKRFGMHQTFFLPAWCMERYPAAVDVILQGGHEIAHHGWTHVPPATMTVSTADDDARLIADIDALARLLAERFQSTQSRADRGRGDAVGKNKAERQAIERCVVYRRTRMIEMKRIQVGVRPVLRHKGVLDDEILAAGGTETHDVPVVVDRVIASRHEKDARIGRLVFLGWRRHAAEHGPLTEIAATRERPAPT